MGYKYNIEDINLERLSEKPRQLFEKLKSYEVMPIENERSLMRVNLGHKIESYFPRQYNLGVLLGQGVEPIEAYVRAGYSWWNRFSDVNRKNFNNIKRNILEDFKRMCIPKVTALANSIKKNTVEQIAIDKVWLLNEQVTLYNITKTEKQYNTAARLLEQIATHVDVDAKASNKVTIEHEVDYSKILNEAKKRLEFTKQDTLESPKKSVELVETIIETEGVLVDE